jgi:NAD(P)-dependent dehydrogenase (short-subunit alcohol dehydrogenase family)
MRKTAIAIGPAGATTSGSISTCDLQAISVASANSAADPQPTDVPYAAAKAGLETLTLGFANAYGPSVRVNTIAVGPFLTDISQTWDIAGFEAFAAAHYALGRLGRPDEIVGTAVYLASGLSSFTTAATIRVDGGAAMASPFPPE